MINITKDFIVKFVEENFDYRWNSEHTELRINSPFDTDKKFKLYINPSKSMFIDYKSNMRGPFIVFIKEYLDLPSVNDAEDYIINKYLDINDFDKLYDKPKTRNLQAIKELHIPFEDLKFFDGKTESFIGKKALKYLTNRGFSLDTILEYKIGYFYKGEFENRIFIPFLENGKIVYFLARDFGTSTLRYKNPSNANSKDYVFNIDKIGMSKTIGICEGAFDAIQLKYPTTTAMLSADISDTQVKKILEKKPETIIFIPDNDETGMRTLKNNWKKFVNLATSKIKYYVYNISGKAKDLNEAKISFIDTDMCKLLNESYFLESELTKLSK